MRLFSYYYLGFVSLGAILVSYLYTEQLVRVYFLLQLLLIVFFYFKKRCWRKKNNHFEFAYLLMLIMGISIGVVNVIFSDNDVINFFIYTGIYASGYFALKLGYYFSQTENLVVIKQGIINISISYILLFIPRVFFIGLDIRSSIGFSFINAMVVYHKNTILVVVMLFISIAIFFLSGLRSVLILGIIGVLFAIITKGLFSKKIIYAIALSCIFGMGGLLLLDKDSRLHTSIQRSYEIVVVRMEQTLLNPDGIKIDPNGGRVDEAQDALKQFFSDATLIDAIIGKGLGFSFEDHEKEQKASAHTHITPVAYYVRNGIYGLFFYLLTLYTTFMTFINSLRLLRSHRFMLALSFSSFLWVLSSLFAGFLIDPIAWFVIGITTGYYKRMANV